MPAQRVEYCVFEYATKKQTHFSIDFTKNWLWIFVFSQVDKLILPDVMMRRRTDNRVRSAATGPMVAVALMVRL